MWKIYKSLPKEKHVTGKKHTTNIESLNANVRHYLARFRRQTRCYSKCPMMLELSIVI
ncbi:MAG: IS1 family transposase, partial [Candidatus Margulisbacteria bacterium]|nr:IS1 family transposase [Candidatus Margulisiibacteriota bacterium]